MWGSTHAEWLIQNKKPITEEATVNVYVEVFYDLK
jgi:hypothetical protein